MSEERNYFYSGQSYADDYAPTETSEEYFCDACGEGLDDSEFQIEERICNDCLLKETLKQSKCKYVESKWAITSMPPKELIDIANKMVELNDDDSYGIYLSYDSDWVVVNTVEKIYIAILYNTDTDTTEISIDYNLIPCENLQHAANIAFAVINKKTTS